MSDRTCSECGGPIRADNKYGICARNPRCRAARDRLRYPGRRDPEKERARSRQFYAEHIESERTRSRGKQQQRRASMTVAELDAERASALEWRHGNLERARANSRRFYMRRHGIDIELVVAAMYAEQDGLCYLCERPLPDDGKDRNGFIDHDHTCPHPDGGSCSACRRGLAHNGCNSMLGFVDDDPDLLRLIAGNLERVLGPVRERIAAKATEAAAGTLF